MRHTEFELRTEIAHLKARVVELDRIRELRDGDGYIGTAQDWVQHVIAERDHARAEVERLREALGKAARALEYTHYLGDAKTARSALQCKEGDE